MSDGASDERGLDLDRVVYFSDAVFAIAMTVLVLSIRVPTVDRSRVGDALRHLVPAVLSYFVSFAVIALFWLAHHRLFHYVRRLDPAMIRLNLVLLALIAILPFPTDVLGRYGDTRIATMAYAAAVAAAGTVSALLWWHASRTPGLLREDTPRAYIVHSDLRGIIVPIVFALTIPVALWNVEVAKYMWFLIIPTRIVLSRRFGSIYAPHTDPR